MKLILASASPRRAEILRDAGYHFTVLSSAVDETRIPGEPPHDLVLRLAKAKADLAAARAAGAYAIQGYAARYIPRIEGCYFNVVGLPLARLQHALTELGWTEEYFSTAV